MASDPDFLEYVRDRIGLRAELRHKKMFGEYALYLDEKVVAFVCDNQLFVKPTPAGRSVLGAVAEHAPFPGAKPYFRIDGELDDRQLLQRVLRVTADALPAPKAKAGKRSSIRPARRASQVSRPRIAPADPPYAPEVQAAFDKIMRGAAPLLLFRTVARNPRVLQRMIAGGLLDRGSVSMRSRELMILRTCARCGAEYEWGVHVATFGAKAGWSPEQLRSTVRGGADADCWSAEDRLVVRLADQLHDTSGADEALWRELAGHFAEDQLIELVMLAGLYHAVSYLVNALGVPREAFAPTFAKGA